MVEVAGISADVARHQDYFEHLGEALACRRASSARQHPSQIFSTCNNFGVVRREKLLLPPWSWLACDSLATKDQYQKLDPPIKWASRHDALLCLVFQSLTDIERPALTVKEFSRFLIELFARVS